MPRKKALQSEDNREMSEELRNRILQRDSWRCQICGSMLNLHVHHQLFRSHGGENCEDNLIALCSVCHSRMHGLATRK